MLYTVVAFSRLQMYDSIVIFVHDTINQALEICYITLIKTI